MAKIIAGKLLLGRAIWPDLDRHFRYETHLGRNACSVFLRPCIFSASPWWRFRLFPISVISADQW